MYNIEINNLSQNVIHEWDKFIKDHPYNNVFQSSEMYDFYKSVDNYEPHIFLSKNNKKEIVGVLLLVVIKEFGSLFGNLTSRAIIYGGPLVIFDRDLAILNGLLGKVNSFLKGTAIYVQIRNFRVLENKERIIFKENGFDFIAWTNIIIYTELENEVIAGMSKSRKRQIASGLNSGVIIREPNNIDEVKDLYYILKKLYKSKVKKPLPSFSFFENFYEFTKQDKLGVIWLVTLEERIIGGVLAPITQGKSIHEWYITGLDNSFKSNYPSVVITWHMIDFALKAGFGYFDFMGAGSPNEKYGVRDFKSRFSKNLVQTGRFEKTYSPVFRRLQKLGSYIMKY